MKTFAKHLGGKPPKAGKPEKPDPFKDVIRGMVTIFEGNTQYKGSKEKVKIYEFNARNYSVRPPF